MSSSLCRYWAQTTDVRTKVAIVILFQQANNYTSKYIIIAASEAIESAPTNYPTPPSWRTTYNTTIILLLRIIILLSIVVWTGVFGLWFDTPTMKSNNKGPSVFVTVNIYFSIYFNWFRQCFCFFLKYRLSHHLLFCNKKNTPQQRKDGRHFQKTRE